MNEMTEPDIGKAIPRECEGTAPLSKLRLQSTLDFVGNFTAPHYIVDGILPTRRLYALTGKTGHGKTAVAMRLAMAVALKQTIGPYGTEKGSVFYFAGENPEDIKARHIAGIERSGFSYGEIDIHFYEGVFDIVGNIERIRADAQDVGGVDLVIVDTLAAYFQGDDENSNVELGGFARQLRDNLCTLHGGPCVLVCAHPTKSASGKSSLLPRGGGGFLNELDGNLTVWSGDGETTELHWTGKIRGPQFDPVTFRMETVTTDRVKDARGRLMPTILAEPMTEDEIKGVAKAVRSDEDSILEMMLHWSKESYSDWCTRLGWVSDKGPNKARVSRTMERLQGDGFAEKKRGQWRLTKAGKREAENVSGI